MALRMTSSSHASDQSQLAYRRQQPLVEVPDDGIEATASVPMQDSSDPGALPFAPHVPTSAAI